MRNREAVSNIEAAAGAATRRSPQGLRHVFLLTLAVAVVWCLASAGSASAYSIYDDGIRWPFDTIRYHVGAPGGGEEAPAAREAIRRGVEGWNRADTGWHLVSSAERDTDIFISTAIRAGPECRGSSQYGYRAGSRYTLLLYGDCSQPEKLTLVAAHEIGHMLGLTDLTSGCSIMFPSFINAGPFSRPAECPRGRDYLLDPVQADDRAGASALHARQYALPSRLCHPMDEQPFWADELDCKYLYDCRGSAGQNSVDRDGNGEGEYPLEQILTNCAGVLRVTRLSALASRTKRARAAKRRLASRRPRLARLLSRASRSGKARGWPWRRRPALVRAFPAGRRVRKANPRLKGGRRPGKQHAVSTAVQAYSGTTSQNMVVNFGVAGEAIVNLSIGVRFQCSDGVRTVVRPNPFAPNDERLFNIEGIGPFPELRNTNGANIEESFRDLSGYARYNLLALHIDDLWGGAVQFVERYTLGADGDFRADPSGQVVCDTGIVRFSASPVRSP